MIQMLFYQKVHKDVLDPRRNSNADGGMLTSATGV